MLVTTELRSRAWRSNAASVRLRRSNHTATGRPTSSTPTSRTNRSPRDDVIVERKVSIGYPFGIGRSYPLMDVRYSSNRTPTGPCDRFVGRLQVRSGQQARLLKHFRQRLVRLRRC